MANRLPGTRPDALERLFRPKSIAIVGASPTRGSARNTIVRGLLKHGFAGKIYPVNPSHTEIEGLAAYRSIEALPECPDLALVITPAETVPGIIAECGRRGVPAAIVYSAGFEEVASGQENARRLAEAAREHGVAVLGPNCQGLWSVRERAVLSFSAAAFALDTITHAPVALVSQSGALSTAIGGYLQRSGIGCSYLASVGNETCLDLLDVLSWVVEQEDVRVVGLYLEGLSQAHRIIGIAERARARGVQIVALKAGRSAVGQKATASHTGKIASSHAVYSAVLEQAGIISVSSLAELLAAMEVLGFLPDPRLSDDPKGGLAVVSSSGGAGALLADQSEEFGIQMAEFGPETAQKLDVILPEFAHKANPIDVTGQIYGKPHLFGEACAAIGADPCTEALIVQFAGSGHRNLRDNSDAFKRAAGEDGLPVVISFVADTADAETRRSLREAGILIADDTAVATRALSWLYRRQHYASRPKPPASPSLQDRTAPKDWTGIMQFCEESGVTPAKWTLLEPGVSARTACSGLTYPLVVKVLPEDCEHKTELGLVKLRVASPEHVDAHAAEFRRKLGKPDLNVLVQEMVEGGIEVVLSCLWNADFGPILSIGSGGVAIELYRDVTYLALPASEHEVVAALKRLKLWTLLEGFRGRPRGDIEAFARAAARFGAMFLATPDLREFEINPVLVRSEGHGVVAVDALVTTASMAETHRQLHLADP